MRAWRYSKMTRRAGIGCWHAHEGRHTVASIMSSNGVPIQDISDTLGHKSTCVTETVYRHVIVPEIRGGATVMDGIFDDEEDDTAEAMKNARPDRLLSIERRSDKSVELRGFEPLTFCMPCSRVSSDDVVLGPVTALQSSSNVWGRLARSGKSGVVGPWFGPGCGVSAATHCRPVGPIDHRHGE